MNTVIIKNRVHNDEILNNIASFFDNEIYLVGGAVRDIIFGKDIIDRDLIISDEDAGVFSNNLAQFLGGKCITLDADNKIYRVILNDKINYLDITNPVNNSLKEDAIRRDLSINAIFVNIRTGEVIDFVNGNLNINKSDDLKSVRSKMNMAINEILITIMKEFKSFDCYKEVEQLILAIRDGFTTLILWGYLDIKTAKNDFKNKILTELIKYNKRKQKLKELEIYFGYPTPLVIELYNNLLQEEKFNKIYNEYVTTSKKVKIKLKKIFTKQ